MAEGISKAKGRRSSKTNRMGKRVSVTKAGKNALPPVAGKHITTPDQRKRGMWLASLQKSGHFVRRPRIAA